MKNSIKHSTEHGFYIKCTMALITGLMLFQFFSSLSVHYSNSRTVLAMKQAISQGYVAVPGKTILPALETLKSAFAGGLFFTLTSGAAICLIALGFALAYISFDQKKNTVMKKTTGICFFLVISLMGFLVNQISFLPMETAALTLSPLLVFFSCKAFAGTKKIQISGKRIAINSIFPLILAVILVFFTSNRSISFFSDFRDTFLMNNPLGMVINNFYYTHTLSPAEVFKSFEQKQIRTCRIIVEKGDRELETPLKDVLVSLDVLPLQKIISPDIVFRTNGDKLLFLKAEKLIMETRTVDFISSHRELLKKFSEKTDNYKNYRRLTGISLITGLPLLAYLTMYSLFFFMFELILKILQLPLILRLRRNEFKNTPWPLSRINGIMKGTDVAVSCTCFVLALLAMVFLFTKTADPIPYSNIKPALEATDLSVRIRGLKAVEEYRLADAHSPELIRFMKSPSPLERYWAARASAGTENTIVYSRLEELTLDTHPNVACQAFYAIGITGRREAVDIIRQNIEKTTNWYVQWYAYKALRRLGWNQHMAK